MQTEFDMLTAEVLHELDSAIRTSKSLRHFQIVLNRITPNSLPTAQWLKIWAWENEFKRNFPFVDRPSLPRSEPVIVDLRQELATIFESISNSKMVETSRGNDQHVY